MGKRSGHPTEKFKAIGAQYLLIISQGSVYDAFASGRWIRTKLRTTEPFNNESSIDDL